MDNIDHKQIFGTPILIFKNVYNLSDTEFKHIDNISKGGKTTNVDISTSLKHKIDDCARKYVDDVICVDNHFEITSSWIARSLDTHVTHTHKNCIFSAVYYAKADNAEINFYRPNNIITDAYNFDLNYKKWNEYNSTQYTFIVKTGDVIIFPGHILHEGVNLSKEEKIIIGANYFIRGQVGKREMVTELVI
jgi:hypothetical protein